MTAVLTPRHRGSGKAATPLTDIADTFGTYGKRSVAVASATGVALTAVVASTAAATTVPTAPVPTPKDDFVSALESTNTTTLVSLDMDWDSGDNPAVAVAEPAPEPEPEPAPVAQEAQTDTASRSDGYTETQTETYSDDTYYEEPSYETYSAPAAANGSIADTALAYVGSSYSWGGSGPYSFDCSGFTSYIYGLYGIYLPHSSYAQGGYGTQISYSEAQPGDLVVWPYGHVAIYLGNGQIVHASTPSTGVTTGSLFGSYYFVRL